MKLTISTKPCALTDFYDAVAREMGYTNTNAIRYDCTKIEIASNIQDDFYEYYTTTARETDPTLSDSDITTGITMLLVMSGPKVSHDLKANEVEIYDGFIIC